MMRSFFYSFLCLCFSLAGIFPTLALAGNGPKMVIEEPRIDFGEVEQWDLLYHTFLIANEGNETLRIERVSPD
jgi:hypothetical protein